MSKARDKQRGSTRRRGRRPGRTGSGRTAGDYVQQGLDAIGGRGRGRGRGRMRRGRSRGITGTELRGFNRVSRLLGKFGMVPRKLKGARLRRKT